MQASLTAWIETFPPTSSTMETQLLKELQAAHIEIVPRQPAIPGILICTTIRSETYELISNASQGGVHRLLVVLPDQSIANTTGTWPLLQAGAADVLILSQCKAPANQLIARLQRWNEVDQLLNSPLITRNIIGRSKTWITTLRQVIEVARYTSAPILLLGETGTGKEQIARLIHTLDNRSDKGDLVVVDCTTIVPELSGSEFFGHERGAFTSAVNTREGAFALADRGSLFLDEVGELPVALQAQLLRVVQEQTYKRVGSNTWRQTRFRLICATNRDLQAAETASFFRRDLYYRIAGWVCMLPPLRERTEDIVPLAHYFMQQLRPEQSAPELDPAVVEYLLTRQYPGNIRDLRQLVSRVLYRHVGNGPITIGDIPEDERPSRSWAPLQWGETVFEPAIQQALALGAGMKEIRRVVDDLTIRVAVDNAQGNLQRAAQQLGVTDRALQIRRATQRQNLPDDTLTGAA